MIILSNEVTKQAIVTWFTLKPDHVSLSLIFQAIYPRNQPLWLVVSRYTLVAVSWNRALRSSGEKPSEMRMKAFHITVYEYDILSTGKLLSNIQRSAPNCSMHQTSPNVTTRSFVKVRISSAVTTYIAFAITYQLDLTTFKLNYSYGGHER